MCPLLFSKAANVTFGSVTLNLLVWILWHFSSTPPPDSAETAMFCIFVFCWKQMVLRILCRPLRQWEAPWGAVKWRAGITYLMKRKGLQETLVISSFQSPSASQNEQLHTLNPEGQSRSTTPRRTASSRLSFPSFVVVPGWLTQPFSGPPVIWSHLTCIFVLSSSLGTCQGKVGKYTHA